MTAQLNIEALCESSLNHCLMTGLQPKEWRWDMLAIKMAVILLVTAKKGDAIPFSPMPENAHASKCVGFYRGLPIFLMHKLQSSPAVACIGSASESPP